MRPLSSYRIKTPALQEKSISRMTSELNNSNISSRVNSMERSSSSDQISDIINDSSSLTVGPTLQGNPLKALMARKKTSVSNHSNLNDSLISEKDYHETTITKFKDLKQTIEHLENKKTSLENKTLHNELITWRKEHAKKLEERKQYFEPQVLKIEDDYDNNNALKVFSDNDDANNFNYYDEYHDIKYSNELTIDNKLSKEMDSLISPRAAFASIYKTNEAAEIDGKSELNFEFTFSIVI